MSHALRWIDSNLTRLTALSDSIWEYAEIGYHEQRSAAAQASFLEQEGFRVQFGMTDLPTALTASYGDDRPIVGFLGEYDALLGVSQTRSPRQSPLIAGGPGHGCGHNLLGVGSLAAAVALKQEIAAGAVRGSVRYYGCPAEENGSGKVFMARQGAFSDLDACLTWHPGQLNMATLRSSLAINSVRFAFHGRTSHAGGSPHLGISALDAVELMNVGVNFLREHIIQDARIHYVISHGGEQVNVVPDFAEVWYYVRAPQRADVDEIYGRVVKIAEGAALMTGARLEVKFEDGCYNYLPNPVITNVLEQSLQQAGGPTFTAEEMAFAEEVEKSFPSGQKASLLRTNHVPELYWGLTLHEGVAPSFDKGTTGHGSTDVSDVSWITPTAQMSAATSVVGSAGHSWQITATAGMSIGHKGMLTAAKAMALAGVRLLQDPELLVQARQAFLAATADHPYRSPVPPEVKPPQR